MDGAMWGWCSRKAPQPGANKRSFLRWPQLASGRGAHGPVWGRVAKVTPRWAGCGRWPGHHEQPEAQLHLRRLRRVGVSARPSAVRVLLG